MRVVTRELGDCKYVYWIKIILLRLTVWKDDSTYRRRNQKTLKEVEENNFLTRSHTPRSILPQTSPSFHQIASNLPPTFLSTFSARFIFCLHRRCFARFHVFLYALTALLRRDLVSWWICVWVAISARRSWIRGSRRIWRWDGVMGSETGRDVEESGSAGTFTSIPGSDLGGSLERSTRSVLVEEPNLGWRILYLPGWGRISSGDDELRSREIIVGIDFAREIESVQVVGWISFGRFGCDARWFEFRFGEGRSGFWVVHFISLAMVGPRLDWPDSAPGSSDSKLTNPFAWLVADMGLGGPSFITSSIGREYSSTGSCRGREPFVSLTLDVYFVRLVPRRWVNIKSWYSGKKDVILTAGAGSPFRQ